MKKITQIDYQIILLEKMGPNISAFEKCKLESLKEQKCLMATHGIELKATVVPKFPKKPLINSKTSCLKSNELGIHEDVTQEDGIEKGVLKDVNKVSIDTNNSKEKGDLIRKKSKNSGQGVSSPYLMFQKHERELLNKKDPKAKLDLQTLRQTWSKMSVIEKAVYKEKVQLAKDELGEDFRRKIKANALSAEEKKRRRKAADKKYREKMSQHQSEKKEEDSSLTEKLKEIILIKEKKLDQMLKYVGNLKSEVLEAQKKKKEVQEKFVEKDVEGMVLKEQFKALHKIHKACGKDD